MKKLFLILSIVSLLVFPIMTTMSCDDETANEPVNPFVGTWEDENNLSGGVRYVFTETKVSQYSTNRVNQIEPLLIFAGVYTYNDTHITIITDYRHEEIQNLEIYPNPFVWIYSFEGDILKIAFGIVKKIN